MGVPWRERGGSGTPGTLPWLRPCLNNEQNKLYAKYGEKPLAYELIRVWVRSVTSDLGALLLSSKLQYLTVVNVSVGFHQLHFNRFLHCCE